VIADHSRRLSRKATWLRADPTHDLFDRAQRIPGVVAFAGAATTDPTMLPVDALTELTHQAVDTFGPVIGEYGPIQGFAPLIEALLPRLADAGVDTTPAGVQVTTGATGALHAVCAATIDPGDRILVAEPSHRVDTGFFTGFGAHVVGIESDQDGIVPDALRAALTRAPAAMVYLTPTFANPTGATMPPRRRAEVAAIIASHDTLLVEDDAYSSLRYRGQPLASLHRYAPEHTVYIGTLSTTFAPAARLGYLVAPRALRSAIMRVKSSLDLRTSALTQALATCFLASRSAGVAHAAGHRYDARVETLRLEYSIRLDRLCQELADAAIPGLSWRRPDGGVYLWLRTDPGVRVDHILLQRAVDTGVLFMPGHHFHTSPTAGLDTLRLSVAGVPVERIPEGVARLSYVLCPPASESDRSTCLAGVPDRGPDRLQEPLW
jgi:DNA-binding transcriptional MocR family regulator